jgi:hypothetical protein
MMNFMQALIVFVPQLSDLFRNYPSSASCRPNTKPKSATARRFKSRHAQTSITVYKYRNLKSNHAHR